MICFITSGPGQVIQRLAKAFDWTRSGVRRSISIAMTRLKLKVKGYIYGTKNETQHFFTDLSKILTEFYDKNISHIFLLSSRQCET